MICFLLYPGPHGNAGHTDAQRLTRATAKDPKFLNIKFPINLPFRRAQPKTGLGEGETKNTHYSASSYRKKAFILIFHFTIKNINWGSKLSHSGKERTTLYYFSGLQVVSSIWKKTQLNQLHVLRLKQVNSPTRGEASKEAAEGESRCDRLGCLSWCLSLQGPSEVSFGISVQS